MMQQALIELARQIHYSNYTNSSPIRLVIYPDRIEVENPGGLYGRLTVDRLGKAAGDTRNTFSVAFPR
jgi:ATP-dependent DNA helicase RecG